MNPPIREDSFFYFRRLSWRLMPDRNYADFFLLEIRRFCQDVLLRTRFLASTAPPLSGRLRRRLLMRLLIRLLLRRVSLAPERAVLRFLFLPYLRFRMEVEEAVLRLRG